MKGGAREGAGRHRMDRQLIKVPVSFRLPAWLVQWLRDHHQAQSILIETALGKTYGLKPPRRE